MFVCLCLFFQSECFFADFEGSTYPASIFVSWSQVMLEKSEIIYCIHKKACLHWHMNAHQLGPHPQSSQCALGQSSSGGGLNLDWSCIEFGLSLLVVRTGGDWYPLLMWQVLAHPNWEPVQTYSIWLLSGLMKNPGACWDFGPCPESECPWRNNRKQARLWEAIQEWHGWLTRDLWLCNQLYYEF